MPLLGLFLICLIFLPIGGGIAHAAVSYETRKQQGLFVFEDFNQWAALQFDYSDHYSKQHNIKSTSSSGTLQESYNFNLKTAILDPHIFDTSLEAGIIYEQNRSKTDELSNSGTNLSYQYHFTGRGLDRGSLPFTLLSYRDLNTVESAYSLPTSTDNSGNELDVTYRNTQLKSHVHIARNTSDTSGGGIESSSVSNSYSYSAEHTYKEFMSTSLGFAFADQTGRASTGPEQSSNSNSIDLNNFLTMGLENKYTLMTSFRLRNSVYDNIPQRDIYFSEVFNAQLGKALSLSTTYGLEKSRSTDLTGLIQENTQNSGEVSLRHDLFKSLRTDLRGRALYNKYNDGSEDMYEGTGSIQYTKQLPAANRLTIGVADTYSIVDRQLTSATVTVSNEVHPTVHQGDVIVLPLADGTLQSVVSVKSLIPVFTYVEGVDYTVDTMLGRINILSGAGVRIDQSGTGTDLYISYVVSRTPITKYTANALFVNSSLSLLNNSLQLGASYSEQSSSQTGSGDNNGFRNSHSMMLYASRNLENFDYRISYQSAVSGTLTYQGIEGNVRAIWDSSDYSLTLTARDRYNTYDATPTSVGYSENMAECSLSYLRNLLSNMNMSVQTNINDSRSDLRSTRDSISLRAKLRIVFKKLYINLSGQSIWTYENGGMTRDDSVHFDILRDL